MLENNTQTNDGGFFAKFVSSRLSKKSILKMSKNNANGVNQLKKEPSVLVNKGTNKPEKTAKNKMIRSVQWALPLITEKIVTIKCQENDFVEITDDIELVRQLQPDHGEWSDAMQPALGLVGKVVKVFANHDVKVQICGTVWTFHPLVIVREIDPIRDKKFPILKEINEEFVKAATDGFLEKCEYILKLSKINVNCVFMGKTALHMACRNGHLNVVNLLVKDNADIEIEDQDGNRAIHHASMGNRPSEVVKLLYTLSSSKLEINSRNRKRQSALHLATSNGSLKLVRILINLGANVNAQDVEGDTALHDAIWKNNEPLTTMFLNANAQLEISNNHGFNLIQHATLRGSVEIMQSLLNYIKLINKQWLLNEKKDDGYTPLHLACLNNFADIVRLFIDTGHLDANVKNLEEKTPLHLAVDKLNYDVIKVMLEYNSPQTVVNVNAQDKDGNTPLHILIRNYSTSRRAPDQTNPVVEERAENDLHLILARMLIQNGASLTLKNKQLQTPLDLCSQATNANLFTKYHTDLIKSQIIPQNSQVADIVENVTSENNEQSLSEPKMCEICSKNIRNALFKPCNHLVACYECAPKCKICPMCQEAVQMSERIEDCLVCGEKPSSVLVEPCGHVATCDGCSKLTKKCMKCRVPISGKRKLSFFQLIKSYKSFIRVGSDRSLPSSKSNNEIGKLTQELQSIKKQTMCPICYEKIRNMVFMCGHSTCQTCGDKINECPICRKFIQQRIMIY